MSRPGFLLLATLLGMGPLAEAGAGARPVEKALALRESVSAGIYTLEGEFEVEDASGGQVAWSVLTDYDHLGRFISSIRESRIKHRSRAEVIVEQLAVGRALLFSRTLYVLLDIQEKPNLELAFRDLSHRDFELYEGSWALEPAGAAVKVVYRLKAKPRAVIPEFLAQRVLEQNANVMLGEIRAEIAHRSQLEPSTRSTP